MPIARILVSTLAFAIVYYGLSALLAGRLGFPRDPDARLRSTGIAAAVFFVLNLGLVAASS